MNEISYGYSHDFSGVYEYHFKIGDNVMLVLPGKYDDANTWIYNRVKMDKEIKRKK